MDDLVRSQRALSDGGTSPPSDEEQEGAEYAVAKSPPQKLALQFDASAPGEVFKQEGILDTFRCFDMVQMKADANGFALHLERKETVRNKVTCPHCDGVGEITRVRNGIFFGPYSEGEACRPCKGTGKVWRTQLV